MYLVFWYRTQLVNEAWEHPWDKKLRASEVKRSYLQMQKFQNEQQAIDFAKKYDGFITIPAQIQSKVVVEEGI